MTVRPIIDAGPALNFLAINKERLLLATTGPISTPETVRNEVLSKSAKDRRFAQVERVWNKIPSRLLDVLPDDPTPELIAVLGRISQQPWKQRLATAKDLGETMVIAHAVVHAEAGHQVTVIIDDQGGAALATTEIRRLSRLRQMGKPVGGIALVNTVTILRKPLEASIFLTREVCERSTPSFVRTTTVYSRSTERNCCRQPCGNSSGESCSALKVGRGHTRSLQSRSPGKVAVLRAILSRSVPSPLQAVRDS